jgi:hypothetical protein
MVFLGSFHFTSGMVAKCLFLLELAHLGGGAPSTQKEHGTLLTVVEALIFLEEVLLTFCALRIIILRKGSLSLRHLMVHIAPYREVVDHRSLPIEMVHGEDLCCQVLGTLMIREILTRD